MKRHYLAAVFAVMCIALAHADVVLDEAHFPDPNFRACIIEKTGVAEGETLTDEIIAKQTVWDLSNKQIKDLKGIEYFTSLTSLNCNGNILTTLDVSKLIQLRTLICETNQIATLSLTNNPNLEGLYCDQNKLTSLDVTKCTKLKYLFCGYSQLSSLDVTHNTQLINLFCGYNQLSSLDVTHNTELYYLGCQSNRLFSLDICHSKNLISLYASNNKLLQLDLSCDELKPMKYFVGDLDEQTREMPAKTYTDIDGKKRFVITMPNDFVNDESKNNYIQEITTPGVTSEIIDNVTYFYFDAENIPDKINYQYFTGKYYEGYGIITPTLVDVSIIPIYPEKIFTMSETHRSTFLPNKEANTYKNTITLKNLIKKGDSKYDGVTYTVKRTDATGNSVNVATVKLNHVSEQTANDYYTYTVTYPEGSLANDVNNEDRWDNIATVNSGNLNDGAVIVDYFTAATGSESVFDYRPLGPPYHARYGGDQAGPYTYSIAENDAVKPVTVPVYVDDTEAYLVSDKEKWSQVGCTGRWGYILTDLKESDKEWNPNENSPFNTPQGIVLARPLLGKYYDIDAIKSYTAYVNNNAIETYNKNIYVYDCLLDLNSLPEASVPDSAKVYRCTFSINVQETQNGEIVENTYGSNTVKVGTLSLSTTASNFTKTDFAFHNNSSRYYSCLLKTEVKQSVPDFYEVIGIRVWRNCESADEENEELKVRSQHHLFYENFDSWENLTFMSDIGDQYSDPSIALGPQTTNGVFGSNAKDGCPEVQYRVRVYYNIANKGFVPHSTHIAPKAPKHPARCHVAEDVITVKFPEIIETGIDGVDCDKQVKSISYYNNLGQMSDKPFNGINIIVTTYTDGTHSSTKMIK